MIVPVSKRLTSRQLRFCHEYMVDSNGKAAAIRAGYKPDNANVIASANLAKPEIRAVVSRLQQRAMQQIDLTAERVLFELASIAFANLQDFTSLDNDGIPFLDMSKMSREQWAALSEYTEDATGGQNDGERRMVVRRRIKLNDKTAALALLGKHFKLFTEKHEHGFSDDVIAKLNEGRQRVLEHK